ncbi:MAG: ATP-binding cassette domain-containing protein [Myxococcota bacterium]
MSDVMIEARKLTKRYGAVDAVRDVSFEVRRGEILGFLGPNGAGKTTTMKILTCFIAPTDGTAKVNGSDVFEDPLAVRRSIGYLPENTPLYPEMLTYEYLDFMARMRGYDGQDVGPRIKKVVQETGLESVVGKEIRTLSKGFRQRVGLAQALIHEPPILILDEPMSGLDPNQAVEIRDLIKAIGKERTIILSTHNLPEVQVTCNRVLIIAKGRIVADDTIEELRSRTGGSRFVVSVAREVDGKEVDAAEVREVFARVEGVDAVRPGPDANGDLVFEITPEDDMDLRSALSKAAGEAGLVLVGLNREAGDLERVFRELTADAAAPEEGESEEKGASSSGGEEDAPTTDTSGGEEDAPATDTSASEDDADDEKKDA